MARDRVFVDTNVILEAFRAGCWTTICSRFAVETDAKCVDEALAGNPADPGYIPVDATALMSGLAACHGTTPLEIATLVLDHPRTEGLDDGELHLLAWLYARGLDLDARILISTADKAAIVAASALGWLDAVVCLEDLAQRAGLRRDRLDRLARHHCGGWLTSLKTRIRMKVFP